MGSILETDEHALGSAVRKTGFATRILAGAMLGRGLGSAGTELSELAPAFD
jgi:hypothetical protein